MLMGIKVEFSQTLLLVDFVKRPRIIETTGPDRVDHFSSVLLALDAGPLAHGQFRRLAYAVLEASQEGVVAFGDIVSRKATLTAQSGSSNLFPISAIRPTA